jgi:A/G-specific adenine glycosylase
MQSFKKKILEFYQANRRSFVWREKPDPYSVFVSEIMLQQTQTQRVAQMFPPFIKRFGSFKDLAQSSFEEVLGLWKGLGYNRRAYNLHQSAKIIGREHDGELPDDPNVLKKFPGIGDASASSIVAFAFNKPTIFIETNIRTVFLHEFFKDESDVHDKKIMPLIEQSLDRKAPREWYYALMDYGVMLKKNHPNPSRRSKHHAIQSKFEGSDRQIRGKILELLLTHKQCSVDELAHYCASDVQRTTRIADQMIKDKIVIHTDKAGWFKLAQ